MRTTSTGTGEHLKELLKTAAMELNDLQRALSKNDRIIKQWIESAGSKLILELIIEIHHFSETNANLTTLLDRKLVEPLQAEHAKRKATLFYDE